MDTNTAMETAKESAKALTKFQEIVEKCFNPHWTKKQNDADIEADEKRIKLIRDNQDMEITYINGQMSARQRTPEELAQRAEQRMLAESVRQEKNLENVIEIASADLLLENEVVDETVDDDWITRLFNIAKDVSSTEMQYVWGKILAGEIKRPGSFSLRTLNAIRNLSQKEAKIFQKILPLIIEGDGDYFITSKSSIYNKYDVTYDDIMLLDECGLIVSDGMISSTITISTDSIIMHNKDLALLAVDVKDQKSFTFGLHSLTNAGKELLSILDYESNDMFFVNFAKYFSEENNHTQLAIQQIKSINDDKIQTTGETIREFYISSGR